MKRRSVLQSFMAMPAAAAAAQSAAPAAASDESPRLALSAIEPAAAAVPRFFTGPQFDALSKLADTIVPASATRPAASQAGVPEFLDFLIGQSPEATQQMYRDGLDRLALQGLNDRSLRSLKDAWTYAGPSDRFAQFLQRAKADIIQATVNSREWAESLGRGRRGSAPTGYYWRSLD